MIYLSTLNTQYCSILSLLWTHDSYFDAKTLQVTEQMSGIVCNSRYFALTQHRSYLANFGSLPTARLEYPVQTDVAVMQHKATLLSTPSILPDPPPPPPPFPPPVSLSPPPPPPPPPPPEPHCPSCVLLPPPPLNSRPFLSDPPYSAVGLTACLMLQSKQRLCQVTLPPRRAASRSGRMVSN